ncbi:MAG: hypothetical protein KGI97_07805, partial [Alphaproteobacteria bacterium]|nr:hypothetical protein [Alphaproteobacteria bacterium]
MRNFLLHTPFGGRMVFGSVMDLAQCYQQATGKHRTTIGRLFPVDEAVEPQKKRITEKNVTLLERTLEYKYRDDP